MRIRQRKRTVMDDQLDDSMSDDLNDALDLLEG